MQFILYTRQVLLLNSVGSMVAQSCLVLKQYIEFQPYQAL